MTSPLAQEDGSKPRPLPLGQSHISPGDFISWVVLHLFPPLQPIINPNQKSNHFLPGLVLTWLPMTFPLVTSCHFNLLTSCHSMGFTFYGSNKSKLLEVPSHIMILSFLFPFKLCLSFSLNLKCLSFTHLYSEYFP